MLYLTNAFSINMLDFEKNKLFELKIYEADESFVKNAITDALELNNFTSVIGHEATAKILTEILGVNIPFNRTQVKLMKGDIAIVFQLVGIRLEEGKVLTVDEIKKLKDNSQLRFFLVKI